MSGNAPQFNVTPLLPALRRYARALTRDEAAADDLLQDTLVRAYEGHAGFRPDGNLKSWLFSILHNSFVSAVRRQHAYSARIERAAEIADTQSPPDQEARLRLAQVRTAFLALPNDQRETLHLVAIEGMAYGEAADVLGIPVGTLMSRLGRARAALREMESGGNIIPLKRTRGRNDDR